MTGNVPAGNDATEAASRDAFAEQAAATGLVLPRRARVNPWLAIGFSVIVIGGSIGVGEITNWAIGPRDPYGSPSIFTAHDCVGVPPSLATYLTGAVSQDADPDLIASLAALGVDFSNWSGGCVHVDPTTSLGDGYVPELSERAVDFAATSAVPNVTDRSDLGSTVDLMPQSVVPVAVVYDLPGLPSGLHLNGSVLAEMYDGTISSWNDPAVVALNPGVNFSGAPPLTVYYRSDAADTNLPFTAFLAQSSASWNASIGEGSQVAWPAGVAAGSAAAMSADIAATPGALGYVDVNGSSPVNASEAMLENPAGSFVPPTPANASAAAAALAGSSAMKNRDWGAVSLIDAPGSASYPISYLSYVALYQDLGYAYSGTISQTNATWLVTFFWWLAADAQNYTGALGLGSLPSGLVTLDEEQLENVTYDGLSLLEGAEGSETDETGETGEF